MRPLGGGGIYRWLWRVGMVVSGVCLVYSLFVDCCMLAAARSCLCVTVYSVSLFVDRTARRTVLEVYFSGSCACGRFVGVVCLRWSGRVYTRAWTGTFDM